MCVPVGRCTYSKSYTLVRHSHSHYHSMLIFMWYLNCIPATAQNSAVQRHILERKVAQSDVESTNYLRPTWCLTLVEYC